ncbi:Uncharacterised protein [Mycobacterium tuberculosis]|uniref:Uncharacterized protein n=1 Tax=Mycobacterium tuberculosis TaxID=1773 RepID=A0A655DRT4_MYCTX|nr:Uncharacterised protein [Mycobacterium tuberculosis]
MPSMAFCACAASSSAVDSGSISVIGLSTAASRMDNAWYTGVAGRTAASVSCCRIMACIGYFAWNCGSEYSDARTAGRPPSSETYL